MQTSDFILRFQSSVEIDARNNSLLGFVSPFVRGHRVSRESESERLKDKTMVNDDDLDRNAMHDMSSSSLLSGQFLSTSENDDRQYRRENVNTQVEILPALSVCLPVSSKSSVGFFLS